MTSARKAGARPAKSLPDQMDGPVHLKLTAGRVVPPRTRKRSPGRPTAKQADALRDAVLHAALHAFMTKGFDAASIEGIARDAKTTKITIYRQFGTKENLFYEVTRHAQDEARQSLQSSLDPDLPPADVLKQLIEGLHAGMTHPNYLAVLRLAISESERFPSVSAAMLHDTDFFLEPVINYLQDLKARGIIQIDSARDAAIQLSCLAGGGARYLMVRPSNQPTARAHWSDSLYQLFSRAWHLQPSPASPAAPKRRKGRAKAD